MSETQISDKAIKTQKEKLTNQVKNIQKTGESINTIQEINKYNSKIIVMHEYYGIANQVSLALCHVSQISKR